MGEIADEMLERIKFGDYDDYTDYTLRKPFQRGVGKYMWRNGFGDAISMHDMDENYLMNCYKISMQRNNTGKAAEIREVLEQRGVAVSTLSDKYNPQLTNPLSKNVSNQRKGDDLMKGTTELRNSAAMLSDNVVTVEAEYKIGRNSKSYTFKCMRDLADTLTKGDVIAVSTNDENAPYAIVYVVNVHDACYFEDPTNINYCWVFQKLDKDAITDLLDREGEAARLLDLSQRKIAKADLTKQLGIDDARASEIGQLMDGTAKAEDINETDS